MNNIINNINTNCTFLQCSEEVLESIFLKNNSEFQNSKFPINKITLNLPLDKQKPIIEIKDEKFFIPKHLYIQSNIRNIEIYENEEYIKTVRGEQINIESLCYYVHDFEFKTKKNSNSVKVKFISSAGAESICIYNFNLTYENSIKKVSQDDVSIDFNNVREMLSGIQISDDAKNMLNNIESSSKMLNSLMGNFNSNNMNPSSFFPFGNSLPSSNTQKIIETENKAETITKDNKEIENDRKENTTETDKEAKIMTYLERINERMDRIESKLDMILSHMNIH